MVGVFKWGYSIVTSGKKKSRFRDQENRTKLSPDLEGIRLTRRKTGLGSWSPLE